MSVDGVPPFLSQVPADRYIPLWLTGGSLMAIFLLIVGSLGTLSYPNTGTVVASMILHDSFYALSWGPALVHQYE